MSITDHVDEEVDELHDGEAREDHDSESVHSVSLNRRDTAPLPSPVCIATLRPHDEQARLRDTDCNRVPTTDVSYRPATNVSEPDPTDVRTDRRRPPSRWPIEITTCRSP